MSDLPPSSEPRGEVAISGAVLLNNLRSFADEVGQEVFDAAIGSLSPALLAEYEAIVAASWVPQAAADAIFEAIAAQAGEDLEAVFPRVVERGVARTMTTVWRALLRLTSDRAIVAIAPRIFNRSYSRGEMKAVFVHGGHAEIVLSGWPEVPKLRLLATEAGIRAILELTGRRGPVVHVERTPDGARFTARWTR